MPRGRSTRTSRARCSCPPSAHLGTVPSATAPGRGWRAGARRARCQLARRRFGERSRFRTRLVAPTIVTTWCSGKRRSPPKSADARRSRPPDSECPPRPITGTRPRPVAPGVGQFRLARGLLGDRFLEHAFRDGLWSEVLVPVDGCVTVREDSAFELARPSRARGHRVTLDRIVELGEHFVLFDDGAAIDVDARHPARFRRQDQSAQSSSAAHCALDGLHLQGGLRNRYREFAERRPGTLAPPPHAPSRSSADRQHHSRRTASR